MFQSFKAGIVLAVVVFLVSCANSRMQDGTEIVSYKTLLSRNLVNLNKLSVGMTKTQVMEVMGTFVSKTGNSLIPNPYKTEPFSIGKTEYESLYYLTHKYPPFTSIKESQATPVVLKSDRVVGWGWDTLQKAKAGGFE